MELLLNPMIQDKNKARKELSPFQSTLEITLTKFSSNLFTKRGDDYL